MMPWLRVALLPTLRLSWLRLSGFGFVAVAIGLTGCSGPKVVAADDGLAPPPPSAARAVAGGALGGDAAGRDAAPSARAKPGTEPGAEANSARAVLAALESTYETNPQLNDARQQLKAVDEQVAQALAAFRPQLQASAGDERIRDLTFNRYQPGYRAPYSSETTSNHVQKTATVSLAQPIYTPGAAAAVQAAKNMVLAVRAGVRSVEQSTLLNALTAYVQVWRDQQLLNLFKSNEAALVNFSDMTQQRFKYGEVSNTDNLQSETRLAKARADRIGAEGTLEGSRATFDQIVGFPSGAVPDALPASLFATFTALVPATLDEALAVAGQNSADVLSSRHAVAAARAAIDAIGRDRDPQIRLLGNLFYSLDHILVQRPADWSGQYSNRDSGYQVGIQVVIPLYRAGTTDSQVRAAQQVLLQRQFDVDLALRGAGKAVTTAWQNLSAARRALDDRMRALTAAEQALDGVRLEAVAGTRSVLDILNAQQELVDARAALVATRFNQWTATATLLAAIGRFTAQDLGLTVTLFDPERNYRNVHSRWIGTSIELPASLPRQQ